VAPISSFRAPAEAGAGVSGAAEAVRARRFGRDKRGVIALDENNLKLGPI